MNGNQKCCCQLCQPTMEVEPSQDEGAFVTDVPTEPDAEQLNQVFDSVTRSWRRRFLEARRARLARN